MSERKYLTSEDVDKIALHFHNEDETLTPLCDTIEAIIDRQLASAQAEIVELRRFIDSVNEVLPDRI